MIIVADNINPMNPAAARAMAERDEAALAGLAGRLSARGADLVDVNPGYLSRRRLGLMPWLAETLEGATDAGLILDSPQPEALAPGLAALKGPPTLSALTLEPAKLDGILPLALEAEADLVLLLLDERSFSPPRLGEKMSIAVELWQKATSAGVPPSKLIFDPVLPNLAWPEAERHLESSVETVRSIASGELFGEPLRTMAGLSNLRSGLRDRVPPEVARSALERLAEAGLSMALLDVLDPVLMEAASKA